jgi:hypothetical protein
MCPTRRTVLSYIAALGPVTTTPLLGAVLNRDDRPVKKEESASHDREIATQHLLDATGPTFYVANGGSDQNPGTESRPLATLTKAQQLIRALDKKPGKAIKVLVRKGTYYFEKPLVFEPADSGSADCPITYAAYPGEDVTLSGGRRLDCRWVPYKDGIMMCNLPKDAKGRLHFTQLFVDGKRQVRARYPSYNAGNPLVWGEGYINVAGAAESWPATEFSFDPVTFTKKSWNKPQEAVVHIFPLDYWGILQWQIKDIDWKSHVVKLGWGGFQLNALEFGIAATGLGKSQLYSAESDKDALKSRFYIENVFEELDSPAEWYLDSDQGILYYMPTPGVVLQHAKIEVPILERLIEFRGSQQEPVHHIRVADFRLAHTASTFMQQYEAPSRGDWTIHRGGTVFFEGAEDCATDNCFFDAAGGNAVFISNYNQRVRVSGNKFTEAGDSAVALVGSESLIQGTNHPVPTGNLITNNLIHDCGVFGKQIAGVFMSITLNNTISHNLMYNLPRAAICVNDGWGGGHTIELNEIHDTVRETTDHGPFNSWGRGRFWCFEQNHGPNSHGSGYHENQRDYLFYYPEEDGYVNIIRNNYFHEDPSKDMHGIDLDDGSSHDHIYNNLCVGLGITQSCGDYRTVENNIFINPSEALVFWASFEHNHDRFVRNIVVTSTKTANKSGEIFNVSNMPRQGPFAEEIDNNLFFGDAGGFFATCTPRDGAKSRYTLEQWQALGYDKHSLYGDPMFIHPESGDYHVGPESPAVKLGFKNFDLANIGLLPDFPKRFRT